MSPFGTRILVSTGEVSGERLAAAALRGFRRDVPGLRSAGCAGPLLASEGTRVLLDRRRISFVGWSGPLLHLPRLWLDRRRFLREAARWEPDAVLLVDSPGWNRGILAWARDRGLPVRWVAPPQLWAWKDRKAPWLEGLAVQPLFAFERPWLERWGARVEWLGYPRTPVPHTVRHDVVALLPGTRPGLWRRHLPLFAAAAAELGLEARVAVPSDPPPEFDGFCQEHGVLPEPATTLLARARGALAVPGTGTLEAVRHGLPLVVGARPGRLDAALARRLLSDGSRVLPNRILARSLVEEFYLEACHPVSLASSLETALCRQREFSEAREELEERLGPSEPA